jgi:putative ABC transport system permease protein
VPGVVAVGTTQSTFLPAQSMQTFMHVEGMHVDEPERSHIRHITPGYFDALQVPLIEGRKIDQRDRVGSPAVCMVSEAFAKRYFPKGGAVGHRVRRAGATVVWMTIIGVVGDVRDDGLVNEPRQLLYVPYLQLNTATARVSLVARTQGEPTLMATSIRQAIWSVDRNQPIDRIASLENVLLEGTGAERFRTLLAGLFALAGLLLAVVGVYAVTSASVTARTREASLRLALGAVPWKIAASMLRQATIQILAGAMSGVVAFYLLRNLLSSLIFRTSAADVFVIAASAFGVILLATLAAAWQSRRLAVVSPAVALRAADGPVN